jgi:transcriptional regulator with XRE-family HTH domain
MSAQDVSDACTRLGMPIGRSALANFENGRRNSVDLAEVMVLAAALDMPPSALAFPYAHMSEVEALPGRTVPTATGLRWFIGEGPLEPITPAPTSPTPIELLNLHEVLVEGIQKLLGSAADSRSRIAGAKRVGDKATFALEAAHDEVNGALQAGQLRLVRAQLRSLGVEPPRLPAGLNDLEGDD